MTLSVSSSSAIMLLLSSLAQNVWTPADSPSHWTPTRYDLTLHPRSAPMKTVEPIG